MLFMRKLKHGKNAKKLAETVKQLLMPFKGRIKTITTDNGLEFAAHEMISKSLGVPVYFAGPYSSWKKGQLRMQMDSSDNTSQKQLHFQTSVNRK